MAGLNVHYEVLGRRGHSWTIINVLDSEEAALELAKQSKSAYSAVKVTRERYDRNSGTYRSGQVFFAGEQQKKKHPKDTNLVSDICWKTDDFYSFEGRRTINKLLRKELEQWGITATELIHNIDYVERLQDKDTALQRVTQQTAIAQVKETGQGVQERMKQLYELVERGTKQLRADTKNGTFPPISDKNFDKVVVQINEKVSRGYMLSGSLTAYLADEKEWGQKVTRLLELVKPDHPEWVTETADGFVGELLSFRNVLYKLIGDETNLGRTIADVAQLSFGKYDCAETSHLWVLNKLLGEKRLPQARRALERFVADKIAGRERLASGGIDAEAQALNKLVDNILTDDGKMIGGQNMEKALEERCAKWLYAEAMADYLRQLDKNDDRALKLLGLEKNILGKSNKRKLATYLDPIITSPQAEVYLTREMGGVTERLRRLSSLQASIHASGLQPNLMRKYSEKLDEYNCAVVKSAGLFKRLDQGKGSVVEKGVALLRMCAEGYFTKGRSLNYAQDIAERYLKAPDFVPAFIAGTDDRGERTRRFAELQKLVIAAGIDTGSLG